MERVPAVLNAAPRLSLAVCNASAVTSMSFSISDVIESMELLAVPRLLFATLASACVIVFSDARCA